jgi:fermentation-respiration switch protein FrsA (DUF1100 family)
MKELWKRAGKFILRRWLLIAMLAFVIGMIMIPYKLERFFVYFPTRQLQHDPKAVGLDFRDIELITEDDIKLHGWFVPCEVSATTVLILHGNGGNIGDRISWVKLLHDLGVNIFIIDYRGYGQSEGKPFEEGLYRDARAAYNWWVAERKARGERLILFGESLGGAVAVNLAERVAPSGLILQSTFTSARDMAKSMFPIGLLQPMLNVHFDSAGAITRIRCPKLFIHGDRDEIVPFRLGQNLFRLAPAPKFFYTVPGAGHNDLLVLAGAEYTRQLKVFLSRII